MRKKILSANWKMNLNFAAAMSLADTLVDSEDDFGSLEIIIAPPFVYLHDLVSRIQSQPNFSVSAQNCSQHEKGAFTGEVSAPMLSSIGVEFVILGHSERRSIYGENDSIIADKIKKVLEHDLTPIFCCGEELALRKSGQYKQHIEKQLTNGLFHLDKSAVSHCIIAYEPVWAIGTGVNASPSEAQEMHAFIRSKIAEKYTLEIANNISIIYGGSVSAANADELFSCSDVDGGLVGGASLKATEFLSIMNSLKKANN